MSRSEFAGWAEGEDGAFGSARGMVDISRWVLRLRRESRTPGEEADVCEAPREEESHPGVERAAGADADVGAGGCGGAALGLLAFLACASQASRVLWSTGHFSASGSGAAIV